MRQRQTLSLIHILCVFTANEYIGELTECNEGELYWIDKAVVPTLHTWEGDRVFLDLLLSVDERVFSLKLQYEGEKLVDKQDVYKRQARL